MRLRKYILILFGFVFSLCTIAQPVIDFRPLQNSINENQRKNVILEYNKLCKQAGSGDFGEETFRRLLSISHDLSKLGYAEQVYQKLENLFNQNKILKILPVKLYGAYLNEIGYACYTDNKLDKSDSVFHQNLLLKELFDEIPNLDISFSLNFLGLSNRRKGNYDAAIEFLERAKNIRINELGKNSPQVGSIINNIGLVYTDSGDYTLAMECFKEAVRLKLLSNNSSVYLNYINLGELSLIIGNYTESLNYYKKAEEILQNSDNQDKLADVYMGIGGVLIEENANREAFPYFQKALLIYTDYYGKNHEKIGKVYQNLSMVYHELGDNELMNQSFEKAIETFENVFGKESVDLAPLFNNIGLAYRSKGEHRASLGYLQRAKLIYKKHETEISEKYLNTLSNIGESYILLENADSAFFYFSSAVESMENRFAGKHPLLANAYNKLAQIFLDKGELSKANSYVEKALESNHIIFKRVFTMAERCLNPTYLFESFLIQAQLEAQGDNNNGFEQAMKYFQLADSILAVQRNFLFDKEDKIWLAINSKKLAKTYLESLWNIKRHINTSESELAFRFIEKSKNLVLLQSINENHGKNFTGIPESLLKEEEMFLIQINFFSHRIKIENDSLKKINLEEKLFNHKTEYKKLIENLERNYPSYYQLKYHEDVPRVADIQKNLDLKTAVLSYFVSENSVFRMTISRQTVYLEKIEAENIIDLVTGMRKGITLRLDEVYVEKAYKLHQLLIPEERFSEIENLLIIPDGSLSTLPFEALLFKHITLGTPVTKWPFLIKKHKIRYSPSLAIWLHLKKRNTNNNSSDNFLAFAPIFGVEDFTAPDSDLEDLPNIDIAYNSSINELGVAPLFASEQEVFQIDSLFSNYKIDTKIFMSSDASEKNLNTIDWEKYKYIHIATHGFVNEKTPELSGLLFAPTKNSGFDNILYTEEVYNLKLNADLITLSACETALGKVAEGEGILGFSRAFLYSGAKNLLISLWKVNDNSTSKLMLNFYSSILEKGMDLNRALSSAKNNLIQNEKYSHPYYWAPFILTGM